MIKPDECGDFVKANELLKKQIEKQYDGKTCIKTFQLFCHLDSFYRIAYLLIHSS